MVGKMEGLKREQWRGERASGVAGRREGDSEDGDGVEVVEASFGFETSWVGGWMDGWMDTHGFDEICESRLGLAMYVMMDEMMEMARYLIDSMHCWRFMASMIYRPCQNSLGVAHALHNVTAT